MFLPSSHFQPQWTLTLSKSPVGLVLSHSRKHLWSCRCTCNIWTISIIKFAWKSAPIWRAPISNKQQHIKGGHLEKYYSPSCRGARQPVVHGRASLALGQPGRQYHQLGGSHTNIVVLVFYFVCVSCWHEDSERTDVKEEKAKMSAKSNILLDCKTNAKTRKFHSSGLPEGASFMLHDLKFWDWCQDFETAVENKSRFYTL